MTGRPKWTRAIEDEVWTRGEGKCHHCGRALAREPRRGWHIDHYPVAYRDIEDQVCCGVRDPLDVRNLVLSCPPCNMSHKYESTRYCGHSQPRCPRSTARLLAVGAASFALGGAAVYVAPWAPVCP